MCKQGKKKKKMVARVFIYYSVIFFLLMVFSIPASILPQQEQQAMAQEESTMRTTIFSSNNTRSASQQPPPITTSNFLTYLNTAYGIKIQYPSDWTASQTGLRDYTNIVAFYSPLENLTTIIPEYLLLSRTHYSTNVTLNDYSKLVNATLHQPGIRIVESKPISVAGGNPAHRVVFMPPAVNVPFKPEIMLVWTAKGNNIYTLSFNGDASKYSQYLPIIQKMIDSFLSSL
jgi:PsbP-like protein